MSHEHQGVGGRRELVSVEYGKALALEFVNTSVGDTALSGVSKRAHWQGRSPCWLPSVRDAKEEILPSGKVAKVTPSSFPF